MSTRRLVKPVVAMPGEGLPELVLRAAAENYLVSASDVLEVAGAVCWRSPGSIATRAAGTEAALAEVLGLSNGVDELIPLLYTQISGKPGWLNFHGTALRAAHREVGRRRVSPLALRKSPYGRAVWSVKVFSFDPASKESLLDHCPVCQRPLGFSRTCGIPFCSRCRDIDAEGFMRGSVDLRDYPQPLVEVADVEALDFVTSLVDPERLHNSSLPDPFCDYDRGSIFELIVALSCSLVTIPGRNTTTLYRPATRSSYACLTPEFLATAGRAVLDWPRSLHDLAERVRGDANARTGHFGIKKELGPLLAVTVDPHVPGALRRLMRRELDADMELSSSALPTVRRSENRHRPDLIPIQEASRRYGLSRRMISRISADPRISVVRLGDAKKAPILLVDKEIAQVAATRRSVISSSQVAVELGVPRAALPALSDAGYLERETGPVLSTLVGSDYYSCDSVSALKKQAFGSACPDELPKRAVRISIAINRLGLSGLNVWPTIFAAVLERQLTVWLVSGRLSAVMISLAVSEIGVLDALLSPQRSALPALKDNEFSQSEVAAMIRATPALVGKLAASGILPRRIRKEDIDQFRSKFILTAELSDLLSELNGKPTHAKTAVREMRKVGITPNAIVGSSRGFIWPRDVVMSHLSSRDRTA